MAILSGPCVQEQALPAVPWRLPLVRLEVPAKSGGFVSHRWHQEMVLVAFDAPKTRLKRSKRCATSRYCDVVSQRLLQLRGSSLSSEAIREIFSGARWEPREVQRILMSLVQAKGLKAAHLALLVLEVLQGVDSTLDASNYNVAMSTCARSSLWDEAFGLLQQMMVTRVDPDIITFNAAMSACDKGGQCAHALKLFQAIPNSKLQPDLISFNTAMSISQRLGQWNAALSIFQDIQLAQLLPDVVSFNSAISACKTEWHLALGLFAQMRQSATEPNIISFTAAMTSCEEGGCWEECLGLLEAMRVAQLQPNVQSFSTAINVFGGCAQWQHAVRLFDAMPEERVNLVCVIATENCRLGNVWRLAM